MGRKKPRAGFVPDPKKEPVAKHDPRAAKAPKAPIVRGGHLVWRFSSVDRAGPFSWSNLHDAALYKDIMEKLHQFETMSEAEIAHQGSHAVDVSGCCKEARDRLLEIQRDDIDQLMSFRLAGKQRVWCTIIGSMMSVLWWDPEHQVWPTSKKNT